MRFGGAASTRLTTTRPVITPNSVYFDSSTSVNLQTGYRLGSGAVTFNYTDTGATGGNIALVAVRVQQPQAVGVKRSPRGLPVPNMRGPQVKAWMARPRPLAFQGSAGAVANSTLSAPGDATASFVGAAQKQQHVLSAAGDATATFTGASKAAAVLSAAGDATATFTGAAKAASVLSAAADATASFTGAAQGQ
jgi:hypothetical protein